MAADLERAKNLLLGAVDTVIALTQDPSSSSSTPARGIPARDRPRDLPRDLPSSSVEEHRRLFGFKPSKGKRALGKGRRKGKSRACTTWKKECICLRDKDQMWKPSSEEKIELARIGLGHSEVVFNSDGDAKHIHRILMEKFPVLERCGGYTLLRLAENSHSMVEIEGPEAGTSVAYLKDILNHAKLDHCRKIITEADMKAPSVICIVSCINMLVTGVDFQDAGEPHEYCNALLPLSQLRKHVTSCKKQRYVSVKHHINALCHCIMLRTRNRDITVSKGVCCMCMCVCVCVCVCVCLSMCLPYCWGVVNHIATYTLKVMQCQVIYVLVDLQVHWGCQF